MSAVDLKDECLVQSVVSGRVRYGWTPRDDYDFGDSFADYGSEALQSVPGRNDDETDSEVSVSYCQNGYRYFSGVYLVRGVGKRSVRVIVRPFYAFRHSGVSEEFLAIRAARLASKKGWRKVVVAPDDYLGEDARLFNMDQYLVQNPRLGHQGAFLHYMGEARNSRL